MHLILLAMLTGMATGGSIGLGLDLVNANPNLLFIILCLVTGAILGTLLGLALEIDRRVQGWLCWVVALGSAVFFGLLFTFFTLFVTPEHAVTNWRLPVIFCLSGLLPGLLLGLIFGQGTSNEREATPAPLKLNSINLYSQYQTGEFESTEAAGQIGQLEEWVPRYWTKGMVQVEQAGTKQRIKVEIYPDNSCLEVEIMVGPGYPAVIPQALVRLDGRMRIFQSSVLEFWDGEATLVDLVENIVALMGFTPQFSYNK